MRPKKTNQPLTVAYLVCCLCCCLTRITKRVLSRRSVFYSYWTLSVCAFDCCTRHVCFPAFNNSSRVQAWLHGFTESSLWGLPIFTSFTLSLALLATKAPSQQEMKEIYLSLMRHSRQESPFIISTVISAQVSRAAQQLPSDSQPVSSSDCRCWRFEDVMQGLTLTQKTTGTVKDTGLSLSQ